MAAFEEMLAGYARLIHHPTSPKVGDFIEIDLRHVHELQNDEEVGQFRAYLRSLGFTVEG